jgi:glycosyltransferase involved in cell wall biosynthesis
VKTYYLYPSPTRGEFNRGWGGIRGSIEHHNRLLPEFGWREVHTEQEADIVVGYLSTKSKRLDVFHLRGLYPTGEIEMNQGFWFSNAKIINNLRRARHVICCSEWVADILRRDMHMSPEVVPGHGIDLDLWDKTEPYQRPDHAAYALWNKSRRHGVCDPAPVVTLAQAFPNHQFMTTFLPPEYDSERVENITVTGVMDYQGMWPIVKGSSIYIATTKETFGRGILEAMASGSAVVGYEWGAVPDIVGDTAILVPPEDEEALIEAFGQALERKEELAHKSRQRLIDYFGWEGIVKQTAQIYDRALASLEPHHPKVSVVIPVHNYEQYVGLAVRSVLAQTLQDKELIVVDDGSTDDSVTAVKEAIAGAPNTRLIEQENMGVAHARNTGIRAARGEYIACLDADDAVAPEFLERLVPVLDDDPSLGIAYTTLRFMYEDDGISLDNNSWPKQYSPERGLDGNQIPTCCLFRRSWWERVGGYRQRYAPYGAGQEDADFWFRILANGGGAYRVDGEGLFYYRRHPTQTTRLHKDYWSRDRYPAWHPFFLDNEHPIASQLGKPPNQSWPVRNYDQPEIGVVIPVGPGHEHLIVDALDSVEAQTLRYWECVVVNDTGHELDLTAWPYAKVIDTGGGKGPGYARNRGVEALKAPLVVFLDADDWFQPEALETFKLVQEEYGGWVYSDHYILRPNGAVELYKPQSYMPGNFWHHGTPAITSCVPVELWRDVGGFDEDPDLLREDFDFLLHLLHSGHCPTYVTGGLFTYRHATSQRRHGWKSEWHRSWEMNRIRDRYPLEEIKMKCRGCGGRRRVARISASPAVPKTIKAKAEAGYIRLEYVGENTARLTFRGGRNTDGTKRRYRVGGDKYHRFVWVHPDDIELMLRHSYLKRARTTTPKTVLEAEPKPKKPPVVISDKGNGKVPNVSELKVSEVMDLDLPADQWRTLLAQEQERPRPRKTVIRHAMRRIRVAEAST